VNLRKDHYHKIKEIPKERTIRNLFWCTAELGFDEDDNKIHQRSQKNSCWRKRGRGRNQPYPVFEKKAGKGRPFVEFFHPADFLRAIFLIPLNFLD